MRIAFAGTPQFAAVALQSLIEAHFDVAMVLTQPDRPSGRGLRETPSAVKRLALRHGLALAQPRTLRDEDIQSRLRTCAAQVLVVAAYGLILPPAVLQIFDGRCINIHASLLPRWRGAAPVQRAILAGDRQSGISIMRMEQGLDSGPVYLSREMPILAHDTAGSLHDRLAQLGSLCIVQALEQMAQGSLVPVTQPEVGITYAHKISKAEAAIDWKRDAGDVDRHVRAFNPEPGAFGMLRETPVKIWRAAPAPGAHGFPGEILGWDADSIDVACGSGMLKIMELQKAGSKRLPAAEFLRGMAPLAGERFTS